MRADHGPGIEFLEYITPTGGRSLPSDTKANDLVFWNTHLTTDDSASLFSTLHSNKVRFLSNRHNDSGPFIIRDPDGHALQIDGDVHNP